MSPFPMMSSILTRKAPPLEERLRGILEKEHGISDEGTYQALLKLMKGWLNLPSRVKAFLLQRMALIP
jgi:hypothetical protein